jgi:mRNA interferase HigB
MRVISKQTLRLFWERHPSARDGLESWYALMKESHFGHPAEVRRLFNHADFLGNGIAIFNIKGNDYRLIVDMMYKWQVVFVLWIGTHAEYDRLTERDIQAMKQPKS